MPMGMENDGGLIWGTTINVASCYSAFRDFIKYFSVGDEFDFYYWNQLETLHRTQGLVLNLNCSHLAGSVSAMSSLSLSLFLPR